MFKKIFLEASVNNVKIYVNTDAKGSDLKSLARLLAEWVDGVKMVYFSPNADIEVNGNTIILNLTASRKSLDDWKKLAREIDRKFPVSVSKVEEDK